MTVGLQLTSDHYTNIYDLQKANCYFLIQKELFYSYAHPPRGAIQSNSKALAERHWLNGNIAGKQKHCSNSKLNIFGESLFDYDSF